MPSTSGKCEQRALYFPIKIGSAPVARRVLVEQPLLIRKETEVCYYGSLLLIKDLQGQPTSHFILTRIEHLRRALVTALERIYA